MSIENIKNYEYFFIILLTTVSFLYKPLKYVLYLFNNWLLFFVFTRKIQKITIINRKKLHNMTKYYKLNSKLNIFRLFYNKILKESKPNRPGTPKKPKIAKLTTLHPTPTPNNWQAQRIPPPTTQRKEKPNIFSINLLLPIKTKLIKAQVKITTKIIHPHYPIRLSSPLPIAVKPSILASFRK